MTTFILLAAGCFIAGVSSGLLGIGGGVLMVPLFHYLLKMDLHKAVGTSLWIIVPTALIGALRHLGKGYIDWRVFALATAFAIVGGFVGSGISIGMDVGLLRKAFAVFLFFVAVAMFFK